MGFRRFVVAFAVVAMLASTLAPAPASFHSC